MDMPSGYPLLFDFPESSDILPALASACALSSEDDPFVFSALLDSFPSSATFDIFDFLNTLVALLSCLVASVSSPSLPDLLSCLSALASPFLADLLDEESPLLSILLDGPLVFLGMDMSCFSLGDFPLVSSDESLPALASTGTFSALLLLSEDDPLGSFILSLPLLPLDLLLSSSLLPVLAALASTGPFSALLDDPLAASSDLPDLEPLSPSALSFLEVLPSLNTLVTLVALELKLISSSSSSLLFSDLLLALPIF
mmetsp:Transcript_32079/g.67443  ORF Transcript_32079/g.67443 Transcript_32079/m.67443 type:complete len:256 (+) Transcript_32079:777-1544(+)